MSILNILPTQANIIKRGIDVNKLCFLCKKKLESVEHVFWTCKIGKAMWCHFFPILSKFPNFFREGWDVLDRWEYLQEAIKEDDISKAIQTNWSIWNQRNDVKLNLGFPDPSKIIREVISKDRDKDYLRSSGRIVSGKIRSETLSSPLLPPTRGRLILMLLGWRKIDVAGLAGSLVTPKVL